MNKIRSVERTNEAELALGISAAASWHAEFAHSPYVYAGGLPYELTEGDIVVVFSQYVTEKCDRTSVWSFQICSHSPLPFYPLYDRSSPRTRYGVVEAIKLFRDPATGKSKGFAFLRYEDPKSCILAVDNFNGTTLLHRKISVNHVKEYKNPEEMDLVQDTPAEEEDEEKRRQEKREKRKEKDREARSVAQMRAAMSQDTEERQRAIGKEKRRKERKRAKEEDEREQDAPPAKRIKHEYEDD